VFCATDQCRKRLEACINIEDDHSEDLLWHFLPDIPVATHHNLFFSEPPTTSHNCLSSESPTFERTQQTFSQMKKFAIHKLLWWHFQVGWASGLQFIFFWDNVNNQKYIWIILSKMTGELDKSVRFSCQIFSVFYMPTPSLSSQQTACELWWLSGGKGGILSELQAVLCTTVVHSGMRTNMSSSWIYF